MSSSCLVPPVADHSVTEDVAGVVWGDVGGTFAAVRGGRGSLAECLDQVADHRSRRGLRYELGFLLAVVVAGRHAPGMTRSPPKPSGPRTRQCGCWQRWGPDPTR